MIHPKYTSSWVPAFYIKPTFYSILCIIILCLGICISSSASDIKRFRLDINDIEYWQSEEKFIISVIDSDTTGKLILMDPYSGEVIRTIPLNHNPGPIEISGNNNLFVAFQDVAIVSKYSIANFTELYSIELELPEDNDITDLTLIPGYEDRLIVTTGRVSYDVHNGTIISAFRLEKVAAQDSKTLYGGFHSSYDLTKVVVTPDSSYIDSTYNNLLSQTRRLSIQDSILYNSNGHVISLKGDHPKLIGRVSQQVLGSTNFEIAGLSNSGNFLWARSSSDSLSIQKIRKNNFSSYTETTYDFPDINRIFKVVPWGGDNIALSYTLRGSSDRYFAIIRECESTILENPSIIGPDHAGCIGDSVTIYAEPDEGKIFWSNGHQGDSVKYRFENEMFYQIRDPLGCLSPRSEVYTLKQTHRSNSSPSVDTIVSCESQPAQIPIDSIPNRNFIWSDGQVTENAIFNQSGNYILFDVSETGCQSRFREYFVNILPNTNPTPPELTPDSATYNCVVTFRIKDFDSTSTYYLKELSNNTVYPFRRFDYHGNGYYQVRRTDQYGCSSNFSTPFNFQQYLYGYSAKYPKIINVNDRLISDDVFGTQWYRNDSPVTEVGPPVFLPKESGFYMATNYFHKKCSTYFSNVIFIPSLKINHIDYNRKLTIEHVYAYPNPFKDYLIIRSNGEKVIMIHTSDGQLLSRKRMISKEHINTQGWKPGVYIISIMEEGQNIENLRVLKH